jgi:hypothetical protein
MRRIRLMGIFAAVIFALGLGAVAADKADFSGSWELDRSRSIGMPPGMNQTMTVVQSGDKIELETKLITAQGERVVKGKRTAKWLPRGNGIVVSEESTVPTDKGPVTSQLTRKWILSPDGTTLTIDMYHDTPNGQFETKRIFIKKAK